MKIKKLASAVLSAILGTVIIFSGCSNGGSVMIIQARQKAL